MVSGSFLFGMLRDVSIGLKILGFGVAGLLPFPLVYAMLAYSIYRRDKAIRNRIKASKAEMANIS